MRPKPPILGRTFAFERIDFLWRRLSFIHKVTVRNLLRYGKRFVMTALGIAGCTALILTGFGLKDAVNDIVDKQFDEILTHEMRVYLDEPTTDAKDNPAIRLLSGMDGITCICPVSAQPVTIQNADGEKLGASFIVPSDTEIFEDFYHLRERDGGAMIRIPDDGVVLSEKAAILLDLKKGDTALFITGSGSEIKAKIAGIAENYIEHYVYISPSFAKEAISEQLEYNVVLTRTDRADGAAREDLAAEILEKREFAAVVNYSGIKAQTHEIFKNLDSVIYVLTGSAFALAAIVLYNLTNINVKERIREIATLKVLGFYDPEVSAYVFRENAALTVIGAGLGLLLGIFMHSSVIRTAEVDMIMFGREIRPISFILAFSVTCGFSIIIHGIMHFYLKRIRMVESMKSVE
jgi:putative ABC transport system permease protein